MAKEKIYKVTIDITKKNEEMISELENDSHVRQENRAIFPQAYKYRLQVELNPKEYDYLKDKLDITVQEEIDPEEEPEKKDDFDSYEQDFDEQEEPEVDNTARDNPVAINKLDEVPVEEDKEEEPSQEPVEEEPDVEQEEREDKAPEEEQDQEFADDGTEKEAFEKEKEEIRERGKEEGKEPEEIEQEIEEVEKRERQAAKKHDCFLTPEKMIATLKEVNGGSFWRALQANGLDQQVVRAYETCIWPSDLANPDFFSGDRLPRDENMPPMAFKQMHVMAVAEASVEYQIEGVGGSTPGGDASKETEEKGMGVINCPEVIDNMPQAIREAVEKDIALNYAKIVEETMNRSRDKFAGLCALVPANAIWEKAAERTMQGYNENDIEGSKKIAVIRMMDFRDNPNIEQSPTQGQPLEFAMGGIDWENQAVRKKALEALRDIFNKNGPERDQAENVIQRVDIYYVVEDSNDIEQLRTIYQDLSKFSQGVNIVVSFVGSPKEKADLQKETVSRVSPGVRVVDNYGPLQDDRADRRRRRMMRRALTGALTGAFTATHTAEQVFGGMHNFETRTEQAHNPAEELFRMAMGANVPPREMGQVLEEEMELNDSGPTMGMPGPGNPGMPS